MNLLRSIIRIFRFAVQNILRNFWLSFISITIFILTLFTVNAVLLMNMIGDTMLKATEDKVEVTIYFTNEASDNLVQSAQGYLLGLSQVKDARFVSSDDALARFKVRHESNPVVLASLDEIDGNPFGHALVISAHSTQDFGFILEAVETPEFAAFIKEKDFTDYEVVIGGINSFSSKARIAGFILAGFFAAVAVLIIFNTIRVAVYVHRDEIAIMKLVGANDWFIRMPFLAEAVFYSLLATAFVAVVTFLSFGVLDPWMIRFFEGVDVSVRQYFLENAWKIFGGQFLALSLLSLGTTYVAMRRYLRV